MKYKSQLINMLVCGSFLSLGVGIFTPSPMNFVCVLLSFACLAGAIVLRSNFESEGADTEDEEDMTEFEVDIPDESYHILAEIARQRGITVDELASQLVTEYVNEHCNEDGTLKEGSCLRMP